MLSAEERHEIEHHMSQYPFKRAASIEALKCVQKTRGWVSDETLKEVAAVLEMSPHELDSVATFYNLIYRRPVGRHVILLCDSVSCWIVNYDPLREAIENHLGIAMGGTTADGRFTLLPIACLGACDRAPAMMVDEDLHAPVDPARVPEILGKYE